MRINIKEKYFKMEYYELCFNMFKHWNDLIQLLTNEEAKIEDNYMKNIERAYELITNNSKILCMNVIDEALSNSNHIILLKEILCNLTWNLEENKSNASIEILKNLNENMEFKLPLDQHYIIYLEKVFPNILKESSNMNQIIEIIDKKISQFEDANNYIRESIKEPEIIEYFIYVFSSNLTKNKFKHFKEENNYLEY